MTISKVRKGQALDISAREWNQIADSVNVFGNQSTRRPAQVGAEFIWVKNTLGRDLSQYAAVIIGSPIPYELNTNGRTDFVWGLVNGSLAGRSAYANRDVFIGITQGPIESNRLGQVQISGVTPAQFRSGEVNTTFTNCSYATISDLDDMLVHAQWGPVRILHRSVYTPSWTSASQYWMVQLASGNQVGSLVFRGTHDGAGNPNWVALGGVASWKGDRRAMGVYGSTGDSGFYPTGQLMLSRPGRYRVNVRYQRSYLLPSPTPAAGDRIESRAYWVGDTGGSWTGSTFDPYDYASFTYNAWSGTGAGAAPPWSERSFDLYVDVPSAPVQVPMPVIEQKLVKLAGTVSNVTNASDALLEVEIIYLEGPSVQLQWTKAARDAALGRGSTAGPI